MTTPLLIYTDAPSAATGLARICRELTTHIHERLSDVYRVATLGVFGRGSAKYPWTQYSANGPDDALFNLRQITEDFFAGDRGVVFSITPPSWTFALALPQFMEKEKAEWKPYSDWVATKPFEHWAYLAIESHGPFNQYGPTTKAILSSIDRRLYYSKWGAQLAYNSEIPEPDGKIRHIGHGIDTGRWAPAPPDIVRQFRSDLDVGPNDILLGCVATNTRRKLLPLFFESAYLLRHMIGSARLKLWLNTDIAIREHNVTELATCFGFVEGQDFILTSTNRKRPDEWLAAMYSSCDLTCLPTGGEGFGYPVVESLSCGTPCVTGSFGAQSEFLDGWRNAWLCDPKATHLISNNTLIEPVYSPQEFANCLSIAWTELRQRATLLREECRSRAFIWDWSMQWPHWERWFLEGAAALKAKETLNVDTAATETGGEAILAPPPESDSVASPVGGDAESAELSTASNSAG